VTAELPGAVQLRLAKVNLHWRIQNAPQLAQPQVRRNNRAQNATVPMSIVLLGDASLNSGEHAVLSSLSVDPEPAAGCVPVGGESVPRMISRRGSIAFGLLLSFT
jgi:hypothetical protein